jgi:hypothetical protein
VSKDSTNKIVAGAEKEFELLRNLHILAQTETLSIEAQNWEQVRSIVGDKEKLVLSLVATEQEQMILAGPNPFSQGIFSFEEGETIRRLKEESAWLLAKIKKVEEHNMILLEAVKSDAIRASRQIQHYRQIVQSYLSSQGQAPKISRLVE